MGGLLAINRTVDTQLSFDNDMRLFSGSQPTEIISGVMRRRKRRSPYSSRYDTHALY